MQRKSSSKAKEDWTKGMCNLCIEYKKFFDDAKSGKILKQFYKKKKTYFYCWGKLCEGKSYRRDIQRVGQNYFSDSLMSRCKDCFLID